MALPSIFSTMSPARTCDEARSKRSSDDHFVHKQAVALVREVEDKAQIGRHVAVSIGGTRIAAPRMRHVQFASHSLAISAKS